MLEMKERFYLLEPEVAGQLGKKTIIDTSRRPPIIKKLHYSFYGWMGDDLLEGFGCFLCSDRLRIYLNDEDLTGYIFKECEIDKSQEFLELHPDLEIPQFHWLAITGTEKDDFYLSPNGSLIVSQKSLDILKKFNMKYCDIEEII
jgi:hypothetical protein